METISNALPNSLHFSSPITLSDGMDQRWRLSECYWSSDLRRVYRADETSNHHRPTKHHVRAEYGTEWEDLHSILPRKFYEQAKTNGYGYGSAEADTNASEPSSPIYAEPRSHEYDRLSSHYQGPHNERTPLNVAKIFHTSQLSTSSTVILSNHLAKPSLPLPLIISHQLSLYLALCKRKGLLESVGPAGLNAMQASVASLVADFTAVESGDSGGVRIMGWKMVRKPVLGLSLGIDHLATGALRDLVRVHSSEIEFPFGWDSSDLPLDLMCAELRNEVEHTISRLDWHVESWL
ncbi:hypothetical protein P7C70_g421, partial [Phenoliferia sp. Uapishka_3]